MIIVYQLMGFLTYLFDLLGIIIFILAHIVQEPLQWPVKTWFSAMIFFKGDKQTSKQTIANAETDGRLDEQIG